MKLFAWRPLGYNQLSFFVMAKNKEEAINSVEKFHKEENIDNYEKDGWGSDYYKLTELEEGEVVINHND